ncbi:ABC transporter substrate-binding protein [Actinomyces urogenitalis]|uniref:ABC transporter substrate-binding protein n=1 Tax=Actinomyces urogenitalis TaxID=103621 RepID=UPI00242B509B|nr:sugar ABC transporter substrate-binding protein [Actinomyces urogenitalis]MCI7457888.1 sugar ABC transporter substrate-binding protein [Actinomyces urogenitalis]
MTLNRRAFLSGSAMVAVAATLAACSGGNDKGSGSSSSGGELTEETSAELTLAYWDKNQTPTVEANIKSFNEKYPNIKVTTNLTSFKDYWTKLRTQAEGKTMPDVLWMNGPNIQLYASNEMLLPIEDSSVEWDQYPSSLVDLYTYEDKHYGIPKDFDTIAVFYNKKIFADAGVEEPQAGWTWEDFHTKAKAISDWGKDQGIWGCATTVNGDGQGTYYNTMFQAGGYVIKDGKSGFDDPKSIEGLQCWADWIADGSVAPPAVVTDTKPGEMFNNGKSAMFWAGDWSCPEIAEAFGDARGDVGVIDLPAKDKQATVIHGLSWVASSQSKNPEAALALVAHMASKASQEVEAANGTAIPAYTGTQQPWIDTYPEWDVKLFVEAAETYAVPYPVSKNTDVWANAEADYVNPAFAGEKDVTEAAKELAEFMNNALAEEE